MPFLEVSSTIIILTGSLEGSDGSGPRLPSHNPLTANLSRSLEVSSGRLMSMVEEPKLNWKKSANSQVIVTSCLSVRYSYYATA